MSWSHGEMDVFRRERKGKGKGDMKKKSWSDLPEDLIVSIMECLYVADRVRFRAVCKNWSVQSSHLVKLPWTMEYKWRNPELWSNSSSFFGLYEPLHHNNRKLPYIVEKGRIKGSRSFVNAKVYASLDGWVLLEKYYSTGRLFFFNPFTTKAIYLPSSDPYSTFEFATFSSAPDSPTCLVFAMEKRFIAGYYIHIYSYTDKRWKIHRMIKNDHNLGTLTGVCYMEGEGTIYFCFSSFHLVTFNVNASGEPPNLVVTAYPVLDYPFLTELCSCYYLLGCDGDLLFVYLLESSLDHKLSVLKLDLVRREWVAVSSLGGRAMFLGDTSFCISASASEGGGGEMEMIANRVYYLYKGAAHFQTLDGNGHGSPDHNGEVEKKAEIYGCRREDQNIIWIQPPRHF